MFARPLPALLMICRSRLLITAACVCHLLVAPQLVTSQLLSSTSIEFPSVAGLQPPEVQLPEVQAEQEAKEAGVPPEPSPSPLKPEEALMRAMHQEKAGDLFKLRGEAQINYRNYVLRADEITYNSATGDSTATGHVVFDGGPNDEHVEASHATYNIRTETGKFYDVTGTTGIRFRGVRVILTTSNPFAFTGKVVDKLGPDHYVVHHGTVTSCNVPHPKWVFSSSRTVVEVGGTAKIYNGLFRVKGVPLFYFPFADHPVAHTGRQTGFLLPTFGTSSRKGTVLGEGFYWAINRSMDATIGVDYYSQRGWAQDFDFRAVPNDHSYIAATYYGVIDRGFGPQKIKQGGQDIRATGSTSFGDGYRAVGNLDYLSSFIFRLAFNELFTQPVRSEIISTGFVSRNFRGYSENVMTQRYQNFQSAAPGNFISIWHTPSVEFSSVDRPLGKSPLYWSFDTALEGVSRSQPGFHTDTVVGRFDLRPDVSLPVFFHDWMFRPEVALQDTAYTQDLVPAVGGIGSAGSQPINRKAFEGTFELRPPALVRLFQRQFFGRQLKHVIEPQVIYRYVTGVNNFSDILRFDERDVLTNTNEVEYGLTTRLFSKNLAEQPDEDCIPPCDSSANTPKSREIVTWRLGQKYFFDPSFGGALVPGRRNVFSTTADFTGVAFLDSRRNTSPVISRLQLQSGRGYAEWDLDYDVVKGRVSSSTTLLGYTFGPFYLAGSHAFIQASGEQSPTQTNLATPLRFDQFRIQLRYGNPNRRGLNAAGYIGVDSNLNFLQFSVYQATYNWDCCGVTFELRRFAIGPVRTDNQFRFAFSLANVGTFGNLRKQERLF